MYNKQKVSTILKERVREKELMRHVPFCKNKVKRVEGVNRFKVV